MDKALRTYLAELVGTFFLVFLSTATVCAAQVQLAAGASPLGIAVAQGCVLAVLLSATVLVSEGCLNPAVTLTLWVTKRFEAGQTLALIAVQLIGAAAAGGLVTALFPQQVLADSFVGTPHLKAFHEALEEVGGGLTVADLLAGTAMEAALSFLLTLALFTALIGGRPAVPGGRFGAAVGGLLAGVALTGCVLAGFHLTGAAVNPARWFGPAVWQRTIPALQGQSVFADHSVYWMGPIVGALLAGILFTSVIHPPPKNG